MAKCDPFYTTEDKDNDRCYHNNDKCTSGKKIKKENKASGINGRTLCENCKNINKQ